MPTLGNYTVTKDGDSILIGSEDGRTMVLGVDDPALGDLEDLDKLKLLIQAYLLKNHKTCQAWRDVFNLTAPQRSALVSYISGLSLDTR